MNVRSGLVYFFFFGETQYKHRQTHTIKDVMFYIPGKHTENRAIAMMKA
jgi:hypothetical protein